MSKSAQKPSAVWIDFRSRSSTVKSGSSLPGILMITSAAQLEREAPAIGDRRVWILAGATNLSPASLSALSRKIERRLLVLGSENRQRALWLSTWFRHIIGKDCVVLPESKILKTILSVPNRDDLIVGAAYDHGARTVIVYRGNLEPILIPIDWFELTPRGPVPDPGDLAIADYGQTLRLGNYEAATSAILYEFDAEFRRRAKENLIERDDSLGGSIRRLRLQRSMAQSDFPGVATKTLARIESNEVTNPHRSTLAKIARRLGVHVDDIASY